MSNVERPEFAALQKLEEVAGLVADELAAFRLRAQKAEAAHAEAGGGEFDVVSARSRIVELEAENRDLRARVEEAREQVSGLRARLQFLEEQMLTEGVGP